MASTEEPETLVINTTQNTTPETGILSESLEVSEESQMNKSGAKLTRQQLESLEGSIRCVDKDEKNGLELFCYTRCGQDDPELLKQCRGVVFCKDKLVMNAFPYTSEFTTNDIDGFMEQIDNSPDKCTFFPSYEGALLRMFCFKDTWYLTTHRKLNAFRSKWASRESFGSCFKHALEAEMLSNPTLAKSVPEGEESLLERFQRTLDPAKQYMFLVQHMGENRIVCASPSKPKMYHVGTFIEGELSLTEEIHISKPQAVILLDRHALESYVSSLDIRDSQGLICFAPGNRQVKLLHPRYEELYKVRGNEPSIRFRYLQVRMNSRQSEMLRYLYTDFGERFDEIENNLYEIAKTIYTAYVQRFIIRKNFITMPKEEFRVMKECHNWHEEDRPMNRISIEKVIETLNSQTPTSLNRMLRRYRTEKITKENNRADATERVRSNTISSAPSPSLNPLTSPLLLTHTATEQLNALELPPTSTS
jgi:hypothetical protein